MQNPNPKIMNMSKPHANPLQGHVTPTVQLAIKLASKGFSLTFINTQSIHHQITTSNPSNDTNRIFSGINNDIDYMTVSDGLPLEFDRSLNHDHWMGLMIQLYPNHVEAAVANVVKSRSSTCCLVADASSVWPSKVVKKYGLCYVAFWTEAALVLDIYAHFDLLQQNGYVAPGTMLVTEWQRRSKTFDDRRRQEWNIRSRHEVSRRRHKD